MRRLVLALLLLGAAPAHAQQPAVPIPGPLDGPLPRYQGEPAAARSLPGPWNAAHPAHARDGRSGSGLAAGNGGASPFPGPLGRGTTGASAMQPGSCASLAFGAGDRLLALCNGPTGPVLQQLDPVTLAGLGSLVLPPRRGPERTDLAGGTHFLVRADGSVLVPTNDATLAIVAADGAGLRQTGAIDLKGVLAQGERPFAIAAGFDGHDWLAGNRGTVVALPWDGRPARALPLGEPVFEDLATDPSGTFVVTRDALYRLRLGDDGAPRVVWRHALPAGATDSESGRLHLGSGTPPAIVPGGYVAVADNLNPPRVTVLRIGGPDRRRLACAVPAFEAGKGSVEAHLVVAGRSIVVTNAYGYPNPMKTEGGRTTTGGIARVIVGKRGCRTMWRSDQVSPSAQPVVSRVTGLLYTLTKPAGFPDAWNLTAMDWRGGAVRFAALAGEGLGYNSEGGAVILGPDGAAYAATFGGIVRFGDAP